MPAVTSDPGGDVKACPECDAAGQLWKREADDPPFYCRDCQTEFSEPVERPPRTEQKWWDNADEHGLPQGMPPETRHKILALREAGDE